MKTTILTMDEAKLAAEIVSVLAPATLRSCSAERDVIRYAVRDESLKLRAVVFHRDALRRLLDAKDGAVKIEYLKRDLMRAKTNRIEYRYPHPSFARDREEQPAEERAAI
jgi:hypothetical protein